MGGLNILATIIGLVLTVITTFIAIMDIRATMNEDKKNNLRLSVRMLSVEYWKVYDNICEFYKSNFKWAKSVHKKITYPMLYEAGWVYNGGPLKKLTTVKLEYKSPDLIKRKKYFENYFQRRLPYPKKTFEQNLSLICNSPLYNSKIYTPIEYTVENENAHLCVSEAYFYDFVNSCLRLSHNDVHEFSISSKRRLRVRKSKAFDPFIFTNRVPTIGIVTLTILYNVSLGESNRKGSFFILHKRSKAVAECKNMINAVPAGVYQSAFTDIDETPEPLEYTIFREFGEELLGHKEFTELNDVEEIHQLFSETKDSLGERLFYLGAAINPVNLYLELLTIFPIDMENPKNQKILGDGTLNGIKEHLKTNEESGEIFLENYDLKTIRHYSHMHLSTPALKQIMTVLGEHFTDINQELFK